MYQSANVSGGSMQRSLVPVQEVTSTTETSCTVKLPAIVASEKRIQNRAQQGVKQLHPVHRLPPLLRTIGGEEGRRQGDEHAPLFLTHGFFSPPRSRVLLYSEMPASVSVLRNALRQQHAAVQPKEKSPSRSKSISPHRKNSKRRTQPAGNNDPPEFPFFGERVQPTASAGISASSQSVSLAHKAFVDMPKHEATSTSHVHLLHHELMDYEDDLLYATFDDDVERDVTTSYVSTNRFAPATTPYAVLAHGSKIVQRCIQEESPHVQHVTSAAVEHDVLSSVPTQLQPQRLALWAPASTPTHPSQRAFVLPSTLVRFASDADGADAVRRHHEQREHALEALIEGQRNKAILSALAVGPEQLAAPPKQLYLRCRFRDEFQEERGASRAAHKAVFSALLPVCVYNPLSAASMQQMSNAPLPLVADATPVFTHGDMKGCGRDAPRHPMLELSRTPSDVVAKSLLIADQSFIQQVKKLVTLRVCEESYSDPRALAAHELFVSISSPSNTHISLIQRVALSIQHTINTGQHPELRSCQFVDCPFEHEYRPLQESPRVKEAEEDMPLPPEEEGWSIEAMPPRKGKWEEYAANLLASMVVPSKVHRVEEKAHPADDADSSGTLATISSSPSQPRRAGNASTTSGPAPSAAPSPDHTGSDLGTDSQPLFVIIDVPDTQDTVTEEGHVAFQVGEGRRAMRRREDSMVDHQGRSFRKSASTASPPLRRSSRLGGDADHSEQALLRRSSKSFGGAVKDQRLKRLNSISLGGQALSRIIAQVESGLSISTDLMASIVRDVKKHDAPSAQVDATLSSSTDSLEELLSKQAEKDNALASVTSDPGASGPIDLFGVKSEFQTRLKYVSASKPVPPGSIITGRVSKNNKAKLSLDDIVKQRLDSLFVRYGLDVHPKPGALSEQSLTTLRRCAGCIFDRPHAFCTQCGYLFCIDCFYFIHRPRNETFLWYAAQHPGRLRAMVTTEFMSESGNDFRHAALSIDSLFRVANADESTASNGSSEMPVMASALSEDVTAATGRTARKVLERFRQACAQDPSHVFAQVSGGGLTDDAFRLSIHNVLAQLEERLRTSCNTATPSAEFAKLAHSPTKKLPAKKKKAPAANVSTSEEHKRLITDALDAFAPSQLSHLLEVIAKFQLRVPPQLHRLILGADEQPCRDELEPPTSARGPNSSLTESNAHTLDTARSSISHDASTVYSRVTSSLFEAGMSGSSSNIPRFEEEDELEATASCGADTGASQTSKEPSESRETKTQKSAVEKKYEAMRNRKQSESEPISLLYEEEDLKKPSKRAGRPVVARSPSSALPQHLQDAAVAAEVEEAPTAEVAARSKAELQEPLLAAMETERADWFRRKLEALSSCPGGLVLVVSIVQFADGASVAPLPSAGIEAELLCGALTGLGYSVDWMHNNACPSFLTPTVANVTQHIRAIQDVVIANDEALSKRFTLVVYSRGFIAQSSTVFVGAGKNATSGAVADKAQPAPSTTEYVALGADTEFSDDGRLSYSHVLTPTLFASLKDQFDRSPVLLMDCWPMPNVHGALDEEGLGFGMLVGRASNMVPETTTPPPQSPSQATPSSPTDPIPPMISPPPTERMGEREAPTTQVPPLRLCFSYLPRQGGLLAYYFLRALDGRSLFSRVVVSHGPGGAMSAPGKIRRSTPSQSKHRRISQGISDNDVSVVDLFTFLSKRVETKGARFLAEPGGASTAEVADTSSPTSGTSGAGKKKGARSVFLAVAKNAAALKRQPQLGENALVSPQRGRLSLPSPTRGGGFPAGVVSISIAKRRDEIAQNAVYTVVEDGTLPVVSFPPAIATKMMQLSITNSGNPFADQKATETLFNLIEARRFHLTMLVRCDKPIGGSISAQDPTATGGSSAAAALATSFEEDTAYNARWRRQLLSVFQAVFNGGRSITRNGRPAQLVGLRVAPSFVLDFGVGWCEDGASSQQIQKLVEASIADAERIVGMKNVFHARHMTRSGVVAVECSNQDFRAVLLQTLAATERRSLARGIICPSPKVYASMEVSLLGSERDYRRARKLLALQNMGSTGFIIEGVTKDAVSEKLHAIAARIQAIFRAGKLRSFIRCVQELCLREERVRTMLEGQFNAAMDDVAIELHRAKLDEAFQQEEDARLDLACSEVEAFIELVDVLNVAMNVEAAIWRSELVKAEAGEWLKLFEAPNRWIVADEEDAEWKMLLLTHKLNFREMWQRYYIVIEAYQDRVRLRTEARAFIVVLPRLIRIPSFWMVPPPCDFDFASSLVIFPPNFKALYMKARRAIVDSTQDEPVV